MYTRLQIEMRISSDQLAKVDVGRRKCAEKARRAEKLRSERTYLRPASFGRKPLIEYIKKRRADKNTLTALAQVLK